jgi:radical SAM protein with 4Fe4S-binding SPASM domain
MSNTFEKIKRLIQLGISYKFKMLKPLCPPFQFVIEATNRCNFKCVFCPQSNPTHKDARAVGNLSPSNFHLFLKKIKEIKCGNRNISICLDGEPLMNKSFPEFIKIANQEGMFPRFSSNAKLLTPKISDELSCFNFLAAVDFSSESEVFDSIRGKDGDFKIVLDNLRYLVNTAVKHPDIKIEIVDITHFSGVFDRASSLKKMRNLFPSNLPSNIIFWSRQFHNFGGHLQNEMRDSKLHIYKLCPYPWTQFNVTWDGNVVACCRDTEGKTILGNVFEQSILDIWRGEKYIEMRKSLIEKRVKDVAACEKCDMPYSASNKRWKPKYILSSLFRK